MQPLLIDSEKIQDLSCLLNHFLALHITFQVMTVANVSAGDHHTIHACAESVQYESMVQPP